MGGPSRSFGGARRLAGILRLWGLHGLAWEGRTEPSARLLVAGCRRHIRERHVRSFGEVTHIHTFVDVCMLVYGEPILCLRVSGLQARPDDRAKACLGAGPLRRSGVQTPTSKLARAAGVPTSLVCRPLPRSMAVDIFSICLVRFSTRPRREYVLRSALHEVRMRPLR